MKNLFLLIIAFALIFSFSKVSYSQATDASESDVNTTETKPEIAGEVCPVSGENITEGEGVVYNYLGTDYKFCCKNCVKKFKSEPMDYIKSELNCPVMGGTASKDDFTVVDNVKYYFCCAGCKGKFEKDPEKYLNKEQQDK